LYRHIAGLLRKAVPIALLILGILYSPHCLQAQESVFEVKSVIRDVRLRFKLNPADLRCLTPLIKKENNDVLLIYARFGGDEPDYTPELWKQLATKRAEFEGRMDEPLSKRQRSALRSARSALERRILTFIVGDFINFLGKYLDLDALQFDGVSHFYYLDSHNKYDLMLRGFRDPYLLQMAVAEVSKRTESWMERILTPDRLRVFRLLLANNDDLVSG